MENFFLDVKSESSTPKPVVAIVVSLLVQETDINQERKSVPAPERDPLKIDLENDPEIDIREKDLDQKIRDKNPTNDLNQDRIQEIDVIIDVEEIWMTENVITVEKVGTLLDSAEARIKILENAINVDLVRIR